MKNKVNEEPLLIVDKIFSEIESLESDLYTIFKSSECGKHKGIHLKIQEAIDDLYDELRELRRTLFEKEC
ncbi:MAG: hypothetical protein F7B60_04540 [Desulfurococcales archaeon]|nr:hypothetical protein [Desulfurococcales archaeon]